MTSRDAGEDDAVQAALASIVEAMQDAHALLHECAENYHDPTEFRRRLGLFVQAARNVTFRLQAHKHDFPDFEHWYKSWQLQMKSDPTMRWMSDARNTVTKRKGLAANSRARANVISSYLPAGRVAEHTVHPDLPNVLIAAKVAAAIPPEARARTLIEVTREWQFDDLPGREVLQAGRHVITFLHALVGDLLRLAEGVPPIPPEQAVRDETIAECMAEFDSITTIRVNAATGIRYHSMQRAVDFDEERAVQATAKYGLAALRPLKDVSDDLDKMGAAYMEVAKRILKADKFHGMFVFLRRRDGTWEGRSLLPEDRLDKYILWHRIADEVRRLDIDAFILVAETWIAPVPSDGKEPPEQFVGVKGREEGLTVHIETSTGYRKMWLTRFTRRMRRISFRATEVVPIDPIGGFAEPVRAVWRERGDGAT
jgi:hypothetical protein